MDLEKKREEGSRNGDDKARRVPVQKREGHGGKGNLLQDGAHCGVLTIQ